MNLKGKRIALTGTLSDGSRDAFKARITDLGGTYVMSLDDEVDVLVVGDKPLASRVDKARKLGVTILDEAQFAKLLASGASPRDDDDVPLAVEPDADLPEAIGIGVDHTRLLDLRLPRRPAPGRLTPSLDRFGHYTLDEPTLKMLRFLTRAVTLRQPCLLEGETASSKTSAVLFLAALANREVVRINLNGQTDTSELVGRYVPNEELPRLSVDDLVAHIDLLEAESQQILQRVTIEARDLSPVETQQIVANERMTAPQWRFQEGLIPRAMRHGWWVILDEMNLAEPPVLERLNSVLEREPTLVLTEGDGTRFGPDGDVPVHPDFRVFATQNPAEYQGRSVLSPAFKDRWVATWQADPPGEREYRQMLDRVVHGRQPDIEALGMRWRGAAFSADPPPHAALAGVPGLSSFLSRLAALHAGLVRMATPSDGKAASLGASRRERYVFSRRALLAVLDGLAEIELVDPRTGASLAFHEAPVPVAIDAIERAYLDRIRGDEDRGRVTALLRSLGLARDGFLHQFQDQDPSP